jgi:phytoene/squalene synthetase
MRGSDQDMLGRNAWYLPTHALAKHTWKSEEISATDGDTRVVILEHQRPHG